MDITEVRTRLKKFAHDSQWHGNERALLGTLVDGVETVPASGRPGWVYVRILRTSGITTTIALNTKVQEQYNLEVWVGENAEGKLSVLDIVESEVVEQHGDDTPYLRYPSAITAGLIRSRRFMPGLCTTHKVSGAYTMQVYVHPFAYNYGGTIQYWRGGTIDLTSSIPSTANMHRFVLVGIYPPTNTITSINGAEKPISYTLGASAVIDIAPGIIIPSACVEVKYGMTVIDSGKYFFDVRPLVTGVMTQFVKDLDDAKVDEPLTGGEILIYDLASDKWVATNPIFDPKLPPASPSATYDDEFNDDAIDVDWNDKNDWVGPGDPEPLGTWVESGDTIKCNLYETAGGSINSANFLSKELPAGNFTAITRVRIDKDLFINAYYGAGICTYRNQAATTPGMTIWGIAFGEANSNSGLGRIYDSIPTAGSPSFVVAGVIYTKNTWIYMRLRKSGTTYYHDYSEDGLAWTNLFTGAYPGVNTPNQIGIGICNTDGGDLAEEVIAEFEFFRLHETFDAITDPALGNSLLLDIATYDPDQDGIVEQADNASTLDSLDPTAFVQKTDYDANSILAATSDHTPTVVTVASNTVVGRAGGNIDDLTISEATVLGRLTGGNIAALTVSELQTLLKIKSHEARAVRATSNQAVDTSSEDVVDFNSVEYDVDGCITTGVSWHYRCPEAGRYRVTAMVTLGTTTEFALGEVVRIRLFKEGALYSTLDHQAVHDPTNHAVALSGSDTVDCALNDDLDVRLDQRSGATLNITYGAGFTHIAIEKIPG